MITIAAATGLCLAALFWRYGRAGVMRLAELQLRGVSLLVAAAVLQGLLVARAGEAFWYTLGSAALIGAFAALNRHTRWLWLAAAGALLNMLVMLANGGRMPVSTAALEALGAPPATAGQLLAGTKGVVGASHGLLQLFGDWLPLPGAATGLALWSIGDLMLLGGLVALLAHTMGGETSRDTFPRGATAQ